MVFFWYEIFFFVLFVNKCIESIKLFTGNQVWYNQSVVMNNYCSSLDRLREGDRIGIKYSTDKTLHLFVNGYDQGTAVFNIPEVVNINILSKC